MTYQRRRGQPILLYRSKVEVDNRGNEIAIVDLDEPYVTRAWIYPQRSSRAELPGQQDIHVIRIGVPPLPGVDSWSRAYFQDVWWDVVIPPARRNGMRRTRHWTIDLRRRPSIYG